MDRPRLNEGRPLLNETREEKLRANKELSRSEEATLSNNTGILGRSRPSGEGVGRSRPNESRPKQERKKEDAERSLPGALVTRPNELTTYGQRLNADDSCEDLGRLKISRSELNRLRDMPCGA